MKATIKTTVNNIIYDPKDGTYSYTEELVSMKWTEENERKKYTQSGKSMGEFGENYSYRKKYQHDYHDSSGVKWVEPNITPQGKSLPGWPSDGEDDVPIQRGYGNESPSPALKKVLESIPTGRDPLDARKQKHYDRHVIEPFVAPKKNHEGHEYTTDKEREEFEKDINYNIWKGLV